MNELAIIKQENIQSIVAVAPQSFLDNSTSREKCDAAGSAILAQIEQSGMTDELDMAAAQFIEKARRTVKKMNERRSPVTQLFDSIRKEFTALETAIDPTKAGTVAYQLQQLRNQYAARKHAEEEQRRRAELARQQAEAARLRLAQDIEDDFKRQLNAFIDRAIAGLTAIDCAVTLENYDASYKEINEYISSVPADYFTVWRANIPVPMGVTPEEMNVAEDAIARRLAPQFAEQYHFEVESSRLYILDRLPSKKAALEEMAKASEEEAARIKAEMEQQSAAQAAAAEAERQRKAEEEKAQSEMARQQAEMQTLFATTAAETFYQPKVKVAKKINLLNPEGILPIITMWFTKEGCNLSVDELSKIFKKQITFCEKLAKEGTLICDESVEYIDDIKAK